MNAAGKPLRVMFDTNAYDAIAAAGDAERIAELIAAGKLAVVMTPVQEGEIRQISDVARQQQQLALFHRIGSTRIEPADVIAADITLMARDDILAQVAEACCDLLVTEDQALRQSCRIAVGYSVFSKDLLRN